MLNYQRVDAEESQHFVDLCLNQKTFAGDSPIKKTSHFDGAATHLCSQGVTRRLEASGRDALAIKKREINGNFRILKWRYCTIFQAIFSGDIPLHRHRPYIW